MSAKIRRVIVITADSIIGSVRQNPIPQGYAILNWQQIGRLPVVSVRRQSHAENNCHVLNTPKRSSQQHAQIPHMAVAAPAASSRQISCTSLASIASVSQRLLCRLQCENRVRVEITPAGSRSIRFGSAHFANDAYIHLSRLKTVPQPAPAWQPVLPPSEAVP